MGSSSLIGDQTQVPCIGSVESKPLNHQGSPPPPLPQCLKKQKSRVKSKPPSYSCLLTFPSWKQALLQFYISFKKKECIYKQLCRYTGFPGCSAGKESACNAGDPSLITGSGSSPGERDRLPAPMFLGFPDGWDSQESTCDAGDLVSIPG